MLNINDYNDILEILNDNIVSIISSDMVNKSYVDGNYQKTTDEILDEIDIEDIENYLRKKKIQKIIKKL